MRMPSTLQENMRGLLDLGPQAVVQVVVHLFGKLFVIERVQVELGFARL
jgi:hypothetical protein